MKKAQTIVPAILFALSISRDDDGVWLETRNHRAGQTAIMKLTTKGNHRVDPLELGSRFFGGAVGKALIFCHWSLGRTDCDLQRSIIEGMSGDDVASIGAIH